MQWNSNGQVLLPHHAHKKGGEYLIHNMSWYHWPSTFISHAMICSAVMLVTTKRLHGVITQNMTIHIFTALNTSNFMKNQWLIQKLLRDEENIHSDNISLSFIIKIKRERRLSTSTLISFSLSFMNCSVLCIFVSRKFVLI